VSGTHARTIGTAGTDCLRGTRLPPLSCSVSRCVDGTSLSGWRDFSRLDSIRIAGKSIIAI